MFFKTLVEKTAMGFSREFVIILNGLISSENFFKQTRRHEEASSLSDSFKTDRIFFESPASLRLHYQGEKDGHWDCFVFTRLTQYFCLNGNLRVSQFLVSQSYKPFYGARVFVVLSSGKRKLLRWVVGLNMPKIKSLCYNSTMRLLSIHPLKSNS